MKRNCLNLICVICVIMLFSCQKELNFDEVSVLSSGSLKKDTTDCLPSTVVGAFVSDTALTANNYMEVQVDVHYTGRYLIYSDTINGFSFRDSGSFGNPGLNIVQLRGSGTPVVPGICSFRIHYDTSSCLIDVNVQPAGADAVYTFGGAGGTCTGALLNGTYTQAVPLDSSNTATISIQITSPGNYSITTATVNGVTFSANGVFNDVTQDTVVLTGSGTPLAAGPFYFMVLGAGPGCAFSVTF